MEPVHLFSRQGVFITTVYIPPMQVRPDVLRWGPRTYVKLANGSYQEAVSYTVSMPAYAEPAKADVSFGNVGAGAHA